LLDAHMHYYKRNIGDYAKKAGRLSILQHGAYNLLIDACYDREQFPTKEEAIEWVWASSTAEIEAVEFVLRKFFVLENGKYVQPRIVEEIAEYHSKAEINKRIANTRKSRPANEPLTNREEKGTNRGRTVDEPSSKQDEPSPNQEPITNNQEPVVETASKLFESRAETPRRAKFLMTLDWLPTLQLKARAIPQGVNPDLIKPETLAAFRCYYEAKELENNQGEWENLLIRWHKSQRDEPAKAYQNNQPTNNDGPGWMALQPLKRNPKPPLTDHDREVARKARLEAGLK